MSTIKSSDEHLTLNADGSSKDIKFQANGVEKASISSAGAFTSTTIDATKLTGNLPAISGAALTGVGVAGITSTADATAITIDSSESVGINNSTGFGTYSGTGVKYAKGDGTFFVGRDGGIPLFINRETSQGDSIAFSIGGSSKAKIGTDSDDFVVKTGTGGNTEQLRITDNGHVTMPNQPSIVLGGSTGGYTTVNDGSIAPFNNIETQTGGSNYNTSTYRYTAPVAGWYHVTFNCLSHSTIEQEWRLRKNATIVRRNFQPSSSTRSWNFSTQVYCAVNDYLDIESGTSNNNNIYMSSGVNMYSWVSYRLLG